VRANHWKKSKSEKYGIYLRGERERKEDTVMTDIEIIFMELSESPVNAGSNTFLGNLCMPE
jgi:hypothetical protein